MKQATKLEVFTAKPKLIAGKEQTIDVLVRIVPPGMQENAHRPDLNLSLVLDRSGSMDGDKMRNAKIAAKYCIDQLLPSDRMSTVIFDDVVELLIPGQLVEDKPRLRERIDTVYARNSTALHEAWVRGGLEVSKDLAERAVNRVLLITDGQANVGETNIDKIVSQAKGLAARGVSTTTIGIGDDFNEDLLMPMAEAGGGNAWHVEHAEDMARIFSVELKGLLTQVGHSVTLTIKTTEGVTVADVLNDFDKDESGRYKLPNLQSDSPLDIIVQLRVPFGEVGKSITPAQFGLAYIEQQSQMPAAVNADLRLEFDKESAVDAIEENLEVTRALQILMNARAREEAIRLMDSQNYAAAQAHVAQTVATSQALFSRAPSPALQQELANLAQVQESLQDRGQDRMSRKVMAYYSSGSKRGRQD